MTTKSSFASLPKAVTDEVFDLLGQYKADADPSRVNLGAGVYATEEGQSWPLSVVTKVEQQLATEASPTRHDYLPIAGDLVFLKLARDLSFTLDEKNAESYQEDSQRIASVQTVSGTGANHIGARILTANLRPRNVWLSDPTWANHRTIWESEGVEVKLYPYYNSSNSTFDFPAMISTLENDTAPNDIVVLHACAHNPTGLDPTQEQWKAIASVCQRKKLFPFFDSAYQGFASGDPVHDAWAIKYFYSLPQPMEMCVAQSFSKNFGLYGHRAGAFHLVLAQPNAELKETIVSNLCHLLRTEISMAPKYGSTIVRTVLESEELRKNWMDDLKVMSQRIRGMREALYEELVRLETPGSWRHIVDQVGLSHSINLHVRGNQLLTE